MISNQQHIEAIGKYFTTNHKPPSGMFDITELGSELLVNYLARTSEPNDVSLTSSDLTDVIRSSFNYIPNKRILDNEWTIFARVPIRNYDTNSIYLPVILSTNRILELQKAIVNNKIHPLIIELSYINMILRSSSNEAYLKPNLFIVAIDRLHTDYKPMPTQAWNLIELTNPISEEQLIKLLTNRTNALQRHLSDGTEPHKCTNIKWHKKNGKSVNMTCKRCNYSNACKYFSNYMNSKQIQNELIF